MFGLTPCFAPRCNRTVDGYGKENCASHFLLLKNNNRRLKKLKTFNIHFNGLVGGEGKEYSGYFCLCGIHRYRHEQITITGNRTYIAL